MNARFFIKYMGTKYKESPQLDEYDFSRYDTIVEPFGGTFGFSRYLYKIKGYRDKKYVVYDSDGDLIAFYKALQEDTAGVLAGYHALREAVCTACPAKESVRAKYGAGCVDGKTARALIRSADAPAVVRWMAEHEMTSGPFSMLNKKNPDPDFVEMLQRVTFVHAPFTSATLEAHDVASTLFYIDPPYLMKFNNSYACSDNQYNIFVTIRDALRDYNAVMVHSANFLLDDYLGCKVKEYPKMYASKQGRIMHAVYMSDTVKK